MSPPKRDAQKIVDFIEDVYRGKIVFDKAKIRNYAIKEFSREIQIKKYSEIFSGMKEG